MEAKKTESVETVLAAARVAKENGSTRFCMGAAWRDMRGRKNGMRNIAAMVQGVRASKQFLELSVPTPVSSLSCVDTNPVLLTAHLDIPRERKRLTLDRCSGDGGMRDPGHD